MAIGLVRDIYHRIAFWKPDICIGHIIYTYLIHEITLESVQLYGHNSLFNGGKSGLVIGKCVSSIHDAWEILIYYF